MAEPVNALTQVLYLLLTRSQAGFAVQRLGVIQKLQDIMLHPQ
jgi:hypothetical protein